MNPSQVTLKGTLNPDGTLKLDEKPNLPPGRVQVILQPEDALSLPPWCNVFEGLTEEEIAEIERIALDRSHFMRPVTED